MAGAHKYREGENPASWKILRHLLPSPSLIHKTKNFVALPYDQIPAFMAKLRSVDSTAARALELAILCGGRTDEIRCATWGEFDLGARMWVIPAERTKTGKKSGQDHHVPLPDRAIDILNKMPRVSDYVFPGRYANRNLNAAIPLGEGAMLDQLRAICDYRDRDGDPVTVHGLPGRCRATWCEPSWRWETVFTIKTGRRALPPLIVPNSRSFNAAATGCGSLATMTPSRPITLAAFLPPRSVSGLCGFATSRRRRRARAKSPVICIRWHASSGAAAP